jgi:hypothetical protein
VAVAEVEAKEVDVATGIVDDDERMFASASDVSSRALGYPARLLGE